MLIIVRTWKLKQWKCVHSKLAAKDLDPPFLLTYSRPRCICIGMAGRLATTTAEFRTSFIRSGLSVLFCFSKRTKGSISPGYY